MSRKSKYSEEMIAYLKEIAHGRSRRDIYEMFIKKFNLTISFIALQSLLKRYDIKNSKIEITSKSDGSWISSKRRRKYTEEMIDYLREIAWGKTYKEIYELFTAKFDVPMTVGTIRSTLKNEKITTGLTGHFPKGNIPWNKGVKGSIAPNSGSFKKGDVPQNKREIGSLRKDTKDGYLLVKVDHVRKWRHLHVVKWEEEHGKKVEPGYAIIFKDGNKYNFNSENLLKISRRELCILNSDRIGFKGAEINSTRIALARLKSIKYIREKERDKNENKAN